MNFSKLKPTLLSQYVVVMLMVFQRHTEIITKKNPTYLLLGTRGVPQAPQVIVVLDRRARSVASPPRNRDDQRMGGRGLGD